MKYGYRTPNIKKSISSRTVGKINRTTKKLANPLYGQKGMGYINDPEKAIYNKIYNQTSRSTINEDAKTDIAVWIIVLIIAIPFIWAFIKIISWLEI